MRITISLACALLMLTGCGQRPAPPPPQQAVEFQNISVDQLTHGARVTRILGCDGCHGRDLTGEDWSDDAGVLWTANLTRAVPQYTDAQLAAVIRTGRRPDRDLLGMPSHTFTQLTDADMAAVIAYLRSKPPTGEVHPAPTIEPELQRAFDADVIRWAPQDVERFGQVWPAELHERHTLARYMTRATCGECHGITLRGDTPPFGEPPRPDLAIAATYSRDEFRTLLRTGVARGGREVGLMGEVARPLQQLLRRRDRRHPRLSERSGEG